MRLQPQPACADDQVTAAPGDSCHLGSAHALHPGPLQWSELIPETHTCRFPYGEPADHARRAGPVPMRFAITALGSSCGRTVGQVVDAVVRYLEPRTPDNDAGVPAVPAGEGPASYYADRGTEPGRWMGYGAMESGLTGQVLPRDFSQVLAGRNPRTGARLITAQGSAGRRPTLGTGTETVRDRNGIRLYDIADLAAALGLSHREAEALLEAGKRAAFRSVTELMSGVPSMPEPPGSYVLPIIDGDGRALVTESELERVEDARARGTPPAQIADAGDPSDQFSVVEAARLSGVTARYMRRLCRNYEQNKGEISAALAEGRSPTRAYLVAGRGTKGQWRIKRQDLVAFLERRHAPAVRVGFDLTLTTEKSLGVLALLGDETTRKAVLDAIEAGNDTGLRYLETEVLTARAKGASIGVRGWTAASFRHLTSRALDPFPHHHNVVANTVVDEDGTRRALDARGLYRHAQEASALATAEMRFQLTHSLGVRWRPSWHGGWEVDGIDDAVVREFSRRRGEIDDAVAELEEAIGRTKTVEELQSIVLATRPAKEDADPAALVAAWWARAEVLGLNPDQLKACSGHPAVAQRIDENWIFEQLVSPDDGLCADSSMFTRSDVLVALADLAVPCETGAPQPLLLPATAMERLTDTFLASTHAVALVVDAERSDSEQPRGAVYSTPEILAVQQRILDRYRQGRDAGAAMVATHSLNAIVRAASWLTPEQRGFIRSLCDSGDRIQCAIGRAGSGKTSTLRVAAEAWHACGLKVIGAAVKGEAARHLASGAAIPTETVAWFLARAGRPSLPLDDQTVLVIDEASTLSDRDLDALLELAEKAGAAVRLVGDPAQHGAIAAGGMFRHLCEVNRDRCPELSTTHRLTNAAERAAADDLREGRIEKALARLDALGHLHLADDDLAMYVGMLQRWWQAHLDGDEHPMVDRRHHTRHQLNRLARQLLRATGQLGDEELAASRDRSFASGDRVVARMAARHLHVQGQVDAYVRNGATGTVTAVIAGHVPASDRLRVDFDEIGTIDLPRGFFDDHEGPGGRRDVGVDHAYAVTSYAVQGATFGTSTSRIDDHASRSEAYVDITRGRATNHLFLTRAADGLSGEHLPSIPPPPLPDTVSARLRRSGPERPAIEFDLDGSAAHGAELRAGDLASPRDRIRQIRGMRAALLARHDPPEDLARHLPEASPLPFLAQRGTNTTEAIVAYRARWQPPPGSGPWAWALGAIAGPPAMVAEREEVISQIVNLSIATAREDFRRLGLDRLPDWAEPHVEGLAAVGTCRVDAPALDRLYRKIKVYRGDFGIDEMTDVEATGLTEAMLGPRPDAPSARTRYQLLEHQLGVVQGPTPGREPTVR